MTRIDCAGAEPALLQTHAPRLRTRTPVSVRHLGLDRLNKDTTGRKGKLFAETCCLCTEPKGCKSGGNTD